MGGMNEAAGTGTGGEVPPVQGRNPRLVVVGYGYAGRSFHCYLISLVPGLTLHGVMTRNPETQAKVRSERPGVKVYASLEEVLGDDEVDAVVLATPHDTHAPYALAALRAGKHVVTDKPMCLTLAEARAMYAAAESARRHLTVFHNRRWDSEYLTLRKLMSEGVLGEGPGGVRWLEMAWNRFGTWRSWRASAARGGGRLYDLGSHMLDQALTLFTEPVVSVYARTHYDFPDTDTPSHCQVTVGFEGGRTAVVDCTSMSRFEKPRMLAMGMAGTFVKFGVDPQEAAMVKGDIDAAVVPPEQWPRLITADGARMVPPVPGRWRCFYEHVERLLRGTEGPVIRRHEMLRLLSVLDAAHESIRTGQVVRPEAV